jgi:hypothetical protein
MIPSKVRSRTSLRTIVRRRCIREHFDVVFVAELLAESLSVQIQLFRPECFAGLEWPSSILGVA